MNQDFAPDRIEGYPSFICREPDAGLNWWKPQRSGDALADYVAGEDCLEDALDLLRAVRDPMNTNYYTGLIAPAVAFPPSILAHIVGSMRVIGAMERGFIEALARKAAAGRPAPSADPAGGILSGEFRCGEAHAQGCLTLARVLQMPQLISDDLIGIAVDQKYEGDFAIAFVWTVCVAAAAGALN